MRGAFFWRRADLRGYPEIDQLLARFHDFAHHAHNGN